jgi:threonine dehydrogenase-like Zn-dependent dehydrogenase
MPRSLAITGPFHAEIADYQDPPLQPNQALVKTEWASGKHGTTTAMFDGGAFRGQRFDQEMRLFVESEGQAAPMPGKPGTTGVGLVVAVGAEVKRWRVGDRVFGLMDIRETNLCREEALWELGAIDPLTALCIEPAYVAFHCIRESQVRYGDSVAVIGLGALGLLAVRMAAQAGAEAIFAVDPLPIRRQWAAEHGASHVFDPSEGDAAVQIHRLTGNKGVDVAIELSGVYPALQTAIRCARVGGTICSAGFYQREAFGMWLGREWHHNRLTMIVPHGCGWGHPPRDYPRWDEQRAYDAIASLMRQGKLSAPGLIQPVVSLEEAPEVFRLMRDEPDRVIKFGVKF